jgi:hypothetical protein
MARKGLIPHNFTGTGRFKPFGRSTVGFNLWHLKPPFVNNSRLFYESFYVYAHQALISTGHSSAAGSFYGGWAAEGVLFEITAACAGYGTLLAFFHPGL